MPIPSTRAIVLFALGLAWPLLLGGGPIGLSALAGWDGMALLLLVLDWWRAPDAPAFQAERKVREPLTAFAANPVSLQLRVRTARRLRLLLADAPPPGFEARGHRRALTLTGAAEGVAAAGVDYQVTPRSRGRHAFGDLSLRVLGPFGLAWRAARLPLARTVSVYPDLAAVVPGLTDHLDVARVPDAGRLAHLGRTEGREFAALRHYHPGDDLRSVDWKATARRGWPVVRDWQPERNQTIWTLLDCGRHLGTRLSDGRTRLDRAVEAALALARAAAERGDRTGAILFGAEVERVVPAGAGPGRLGPLAEALHRAESRRVEADYGAAFDALLARQRRRALVVVFTDLGDPDTVALLLRRAEILRRRHLVAVAAIADPVLAGLASARPATADDALVRAAAERIVDEREAAERRLAASGVLVVDAAAADLAGAVVRRYASVKDRGLL